MNTNRYFLVISCLFLFCSTASVLAQGGHISGVVYNERRAEVLPGAAVALFAADTTLIAGGATGEDGAFRFSDVSSGNYFMVISSLGFETKRILLQNFAESVHLDIVLEGVSYGLDAVEVTASSVLTRVNQRIVFPTQLQLQHSTNGLMLLSTMMIPGVRVNPLMSTVSASNGGAVTLQINGRNASMDEVMMLQADRIKRVEYSDYAGIRYRESAAVINFIVQQEERGGVVGVNMMNSLDMIAGGDVAFLRMSRGKSEFTLNYVIAYQNFKGNYRDREESFSFADGTLFSRDERSDKGNYRSTIQDFSLGYNYMVSDSGFFNAQLKYNRTVQPHNDFNNRLVLNGNESKRVFDGVDQRSRTPSLDVYYQHAFRNKQKLYVNLVGTLIDSDVKRHYYEYEGDETTYDRLTMIASEKRSVIGEGVYEKAFSSGVLKVGLQHVQSYTKQRYRLPVSVSSELRQATSFLFSEWQGKRDNWDYSAGLGLSRNYYSTAGVANSYWHLLPKVMIGYKMGDAGVIRYDLELDQTNPTLVELTETEIEIDPWLREKGNARLKPYVNVKNSLFLEVGKGLFTGNLHLRHHYKHNPIMESRREIADYFLSQPQNMKRWNHWNEELTAKVGMIANVLQFSVTGGVNHYRSEGLDYLHRHTNVYYRADLLAMYKQWMFLAQVQSADQRLIGETLIAENDYHYWSVQYNTTNFSIGLGVFNPFYNMSKSIRENRNAYAPYKRTVYSAASQTIVLNLVWNLNFGRQYQSGNRQIQHQDTESGLREIYK